MLKIFFFIIWGVVAMLMGTGGNHKVKSGNTLPFLNVQVTLNKKTNRQTPFEDVNKEPDRRFFKNSKKILHKKSGENFDKATNFEFTEEMYSGTNENQVATASGVKASADTKDKHKIIDKKIRRAKRASKFLCLPCTISCKNKCNMPQIVTHQATLSCYCDDDCIFFKDCCKDFSCFCRNNDISEASGNVSQLSSQILIKNSSSGFQNLVNQENRNLWSCFAGHTRGVRGTKGIWMIGSCPTSWPKDEVYYRCRNLSLTNTINQDNYRYLPVYDNTSKVYHNSFCARCNRVDEKKLEMFGLEFNCRITPPEDSAFKEKINFLFTHCASGDVAWSAKEGQPRRYCRESPAKCNDNLYSNLQSPTQFNVNPITIMFDFDGRSPSVTIKPQCSNGQVFNQHLEECRNATKPLPSLSQHFDEYQILLWLKPSAYLSCADTMEKSRSHNDVENQSSNQLFIEDLNINNSILHTRSCTIEFVLRVAEKRTENYKTKVEKILNFKSPFNITINRKTFTVSKVTKRVLSCTNLQKYERYEFQVLQDGTSVAINKTGEVFKVMDYYSNSTTPNLNQAVYVCGRRQMMNCSGVFILLSGNEFTLLPNKSLFVNASRQLYEWSEYVLKTTRNGVEICRDVSQSKTSTPSSTQDEILYLTTLVCMSLSIIGLAFVLGTYSLFSELRTPPGINLMNLSVSILLAQLLWLLGSKKTDTPMVCTVIAVILHYLFLVSFTWTSIIAVDTWRAFATKGKRPLAESRAERIKHCLRYMGIGWISCLVYVVVCVVLDLTGTIAIGYQSSRACWMGSKLGMLYFFGVPVGTVLIINAVFYIMTLRLIHLHSQQARAASNRGIKQNFGVYVRIATLMGFTWVIGFAVPFGPQYLKVPFALLNCSQGVYIAIAFGCSKRARRLYKKFFLGTNHPAETQTL